MAQQFGDILVMGASTGIVALSLVFCATLILAPLGFFIGSLIYFGIAKLFGGTGEFEEQSYLLATFTAPIMIVNGVIGIIPFIGGCITFFISIYQLVLTYYALKVSHNLTSGKALGVILVPVAIGLLIACCVLALFFAAISSFIESGSSF